MELKPADPDELQLKKLKDPAAEKTWKLGEKPENWRWKAAFLRFTKKKKRVSWKLLRLSSRLIPGHVLEL